jgi:hypothetical protein
MSLQCNPDRKEASHLILAVQKVQLPAALLAPLLVAFMHTSIHPSWGKFDQQALTNKQRTCS